MTFPAYNDNLQVLVGTLSLEPPRLHRSRDVTWLFLTGWGSENLMAADLCNSTDTSLTAACSPRSFQGSQGRKSRELLLNLSYPRYVHFYFPGILKDRQLRNLQCRGTVHWGVKLIPAWTNRTNGQSSFPGQEQWLAHQRVSCSICGSAPGRLSACHILAILSPRNVLHTQHMCKKIKKMWRAERDAWDFITAENISMNSRTERLFSCHFMA